MSLMDDWNNKKFKTGQRYFISINGNEPQPATVDMDGDFVDMEGMYINSITNEIKVLAPCDYDHFIELTEKVNRSGEDAARFEMALYDANREIKHLRGLLKECDNELKILRMLSLPIASKEALAECDDLLTRINKELQ